MKSPAFQFYPDDFIGGTVIFSAEEVGAYIRLLCWQWGNGSIPDKKQAIDRIAGCDVSLEVLAKFIDGKQPRMEQVRRKLQEFKETCSAAGKKGGGRPPLPNDKGSIKEPLPDLLIPDKGSLNTPSPSPIPIPILLPNLPPTTPPPNQPASPNGLEVMNFHFNRFWTAYPKRKGKQNAIKIWNRMKLNSKIEIILEAIQRLKRDDQWTKDGGRYIPHPATWLNSGGWDDEITTKPSASDPSRWLR